jgi:hypothetical protein
VEEGHSRIGSGAVVTFGIAAVAIVLFALGRSVGWNAAWRAFGVTPLQPPFFDMHVINDYAACAAKGMDAYAPAACNVDNFNIPPTWLWLGQFGLDGTDSNFLSVMIIAAFVIVMTLLLRGRPWFIGVTALGALLSPSVMMGIERGNLDLLIFALVGAAALLFAEGKVLRSSATISLLSLGIALKLFPIFCVSLMARATKNSFIIASIVVAVGSIYLIWNIEYLTLIRRNVPTTFILSYGYKAVFLGLDHVRGEAGLDPLNLADTWLPLALVLTLFGFAVAVSARTLFQGRKFCVIDASTAGTAFLFGAGIYCGTYLLGTNFVYRLMFLVLCLPQILDWLTSHQSRFTEISLLVTVLGVLWLNGSPDGHGIFVLLPQVLNGWLFFLLATILTLNLGEGLIGMTKQRPIGLSATIENPTELQSRPDGEALLYSQRRAGCGGKTGPSVPMVRSG